MENSHTPSAEKTMPRYMTGEVDQNISPMRVDRVSLDPMLDDNNGQGLTLHTTHGDLGAIWHPSGRSWTPKKQSKTICCCISRSATETVHDV